MRSRQLTHCDLILLENCFLRCKMCRMWRIPNNSSFTPPAVWKEFLRQLYEYFGSAVQIQFVGGEPLIKEGIFDLIHFAAEKEFTTTMTTNGFLVDGTVAEKIISSGLNTLVFSLDSLNPRIHDDLRGKKGLHDQVLRAIEIVSQCRREYPQINIVTTIMEANLDEIIDLARWVDSRNEIDGISFQAVMQPFNTEPDNQWHQKDEFKFLWPQNFEKINSIVDELINLRETRFKINNPIGQLKAFKAYFNNPERSIKRSQCHLGYSSLSINPRGDVFLCQSLAPIGNIHSDRFPDMWLGEKARDVRKHIRQCKRNCKSMVNCFFQEEQSFPPVASSE